MGYSIYFMLTLVFGIMGIIGFVVYRTIVREERKRAEREQARREAKEREKEETSASKQG